MANEKTAAGSPSEQQTLVQRLKDVGYRVLETRPGERGMVWTLEPVHSQVEFQLIGNDEVLRFLTATTGSR